MLDPTSTGQDHSKKIILPGLGEILLNLTWVKLGDQRKLLHLIFCLVQIQLTCADKFTYLEAIYLLTTDGTSYVWCTLEPEGGKIGTPRGKIIPTNLMKNCVCPPYERGEGAGSFRGEVAPVYLRWSDLVSFSTSSQMWDSWCFPMFLLRDGSFTWTWPPWWS